jgi:polysaccharide biosynthesis/export protein
MKLFYLPLFLCLLVSCSPVRYRYPVCGASEFVIDSYRIKQGKQAILEMQGKCVCPVTCEDLEEYPDAIEEGDSLNIVLYHPTRRDLMESIQMIDRNAGGFRVKEGYVRIPDLDPVFVAGLSLSEAKEKIRCQFAQEICGVEVYVSYENRLRKKVELIGMTQISEYPVDGKVRLFEILSKAHIPPGANLFMSYVLRNGCQLAIDFYRLINEGDMCQNIVMRGGDKIYIANPSDCCITMMGEIGIPRSVNLPYGFMSLREAIVQAGGIPFTGDKRNIQVIRGNLPCPKIYVLAWEHIIHLPNDSLLLMGGDTVYVSEKPITQWNRFIEQLLPSFTGITTGNEVYRIVRPGP